MREKLIPEEITDHKKWDVFSWINRLTTSIIYICADFHLYSGQSTDQPAVHKISFVCPGKLGQNLELNDNLECSCLSLFLRGDAGNEVTFLPLFIALQTLDILGCLKIETSNKKCEKEKNVL
jgi:hypothetical protein